MSKKHSFKVFKKTTRFKRHSTGLSTVVRLKTMKITRKTQKLTLSVLISLWSKTYMRSRQFYRYYQAIGLFTIILPTFAPDSIKAVLLKLNPVSNIFYFSCSNTVLKKYLTGKTSDKKIKSPIKNSRNSHVSSVSIYDLEGFDQVSSTVVSLNENFYLPDEIINNQKHMSLI